MSDTKIKEVDIKTILLLLKINHKDHIPQNEMGEARGGPIWQEI